MLLLQRAYVRITRLILCLFHVVGRDAKNPQYWDLVLFEKKKKKKISHRH